jgi:ankyrin repeat protein
MLLNYGASPRKTTQRGESALTLACMQENAEICERLIIAKANVNELDNHQRTPLLKAARHNSKSDIVRLLLKHGAKPDIADEEGNTPLHFAAQRGTEELAKFLLNLGANPYVRNHQGLVPYEVCTND